MIPVGSRRTHASVASPIVVSALMLGACVFRQDTVNLKDVAESTQLSADSERVVVHRGGLADFSRARQLVLLKIAQECLARGYLTFAFTSVAEPKTHLPNQPPDAPVEMESARTFAPPTSVVPDIEPGTVVTVKFYKAGDPKALDSIFAEVIAANLKPVVEQ